MKEKRGGLYERGSERERKKQGEGITRTKKDRERERVRGIDKWRYR